MRVNLPKCSSDTVRLYTGRSSVTATRDARWPVRARRCRPWVAEDGSDLSEAQPRPVAIDQILEHLLHLTSDREEQIAAVFDLIDRVGVPEAGALLLVQAQAEAEAGRVDPAVADLAQVPACPRIGHGVCNLRQLYGAVDLGETVVLLVNLSPCFAP